MDNLNKINYHTSKILICIVFVIHKSNFFVESIDRYPIARGEDCLLRDSNDKGICTFLKDCPPIANTWRYVDQPDRPHICDFEGKAVIVCCPKGSERITPGSNDKIDDTINIIDPLNHACFLDKLGEIGTLLKKEDCPYNFDDSTACPLDICLNLVCCPASKKSEHTTKGPLNTSKDSVPL